MLVNIENLEHFFSHLNILPMPIVVADPQTRKIVAFNKEAEVLWMRSADETIGEEQTILHPSHWNEKRRETFSKNVKTLESGEIVKNTRNAALRSDGVEIAIEIKANMITSGGKKYIVGIFNSIEKRVKAYELLEKKEKELSDIFENTEIGILYLEQDFKIAKVNQRFVELLGYTSKDELEGKTSEIFHKQERDYKTFIEKYKKPLENHETIHLEYEVRKKDNSTIWVAVTGKAKDKSQPADLSKGLIWLVEDISEKYQIINELQTKRSLLDYHTTHDFLTNLPNRMLYRDRIELIIEKSKRFDKKFALFIIDIDHFKQINDSLGHQAGDIILLEVVKRLQHAIRTEDTLARLGGDEFSILFEDLYSMRDVVTLSKNILDNFTKPFLLEDKEIFLTCSIGITIYPDDTDSVDDLLKYAENAMYKAKDEGRNNFQFYTQDMTKLAFERLMLESSMRQAIKKDEFCVYYQPQYNAKLQKIVGVEALIRWRSPLMGMIPPSKFIPFAEESNLIIEIDNWMMENAIKEISELKKQGFDIGILSLNLAIKHLESEEFVENLQKLLKKYDFDPNDLKLEILERDMMRKPKENIAKLRRLKELSITIALDDFGVGNSSLNYLNELPIDQLKIDQSFIRAVKKGDTTILLAIIALAAALDLSVVAEGVELKEELDFLQKHDCFVIQGYYFYRPMNKEKLLEVFEEIREKK